MLITKHQIKYKHNFKVYFTGNPTLNDLGIERCRGWQWLPMPQPQAPEAGAAPGLCIAPGDLINQPPVGGWAVGDSRQTRASQAAASNTALIYAAAFSPGIMQNFTAWFSAGERKTTESQWTSPHHCVPHLGAQQKLLHFQVWSIKP